MTEKENDQTNEESSTLKENLHKSYSTSDYATVFNEGVYTVEYDGYEKVGDSTDVKDATPEPAILDTAKNKVLCVIFGSNCLDKLPELRAVISITMVSSIVGLISDLTEPTYRAVTYNLFLVSIALCIVLGLPVVMRTKYARKFSYSFFASLVFFLIIATLLGCQKLFTERGTGIIAEHFPGASSIQIEIYKTVKSFERKLNQILAISYLSLEKSTIILKLLDEGYATYPKKNVSKEFLEKKAKDLYSRYDLPPDEVLAFLEDYIVDYNEQTKWTPSSTSNNKTFENLNQEINDLIRNKDFDGAIALIEISISNKAKLRLISAKEEAILLAREAAIHSLIFDYKTAARLYGEAASITHFDKKIHSGYLGLQAEQFLNVGKYLGDQTALKNSIKLYEEALSDLDKREDNVRFVSWSLDLGDSYRLLAEQSGDYDISKKSIAAYEKALSSIDKDTDATAWHSVQTSIGGALAVLGGIQESFGYLQEAEKVLRSTLASMPNVEFGIQREHTLNNLGVTILLKANDQDEARTLEAISLFKSGLESAYCRCYPEVWSRLQFNLGVALARLAIIRNDIALLHEAVAALNSSLEERDKKRNAVEWGRSKIALSRALYLIGFLDDNPQMVARALTEATYASNVYSKESYPIDWAISRMSVLKYQAHLIQTTGMRRQLEQSLSSFHSVLDTLERHAPSNFHAEALIDYGIALSNYALVINSSSHAKMAIDSIEKAIEIIRFRSTFSVGDAYANLGISLHRYVDLSKDDLGLLQQSDIAFKSALRVYSQHKQPTMWAFIQNERSNVLSHIYRLNKETAILEEISDISNDILEVYAENPRIPKQSVALAYYHLAKAGVHYLEVNKDFEIREIETLISYLEKALNIQKITRAGLSYYNSYNLSKLLLIGLLLEKAKKTDDIEIFQTTISEGQNLLLELSPEKDKIYWAITKRYLGEAFFRVALINNTPSYFTSSITALKAAMKQINRDEDGSLWTDSKSLLAQVYEKFGIYIDDLNYLRQAKKLYEELRAEDSIINSENKNYFDEKIKEMKTLVGEVSGENI